MVDLRILGIALVLAGGLPGPVAAQLAPHRALYNLSLAEPGGGLRDAEGAFAIEWRTGCEGYTTQQHLWFVGRTDDGGSFDTDIRFTSWESRDTTRLRFAMRSFTGGELVEEYRGSAVAGTNGEPGRATYTLPEPLALPLPAGTLFPTAHLQRIIAAAAAGERIVNDMLFDGSGAPADALNEVTAIIGAPLQARDDPSVRAWPVALAYHDPRDLEAGMPVFELRFELTERGVMHDVVLDYGDFALRATLGQMVWLPVPAECD